MKSPRDGNKGTGRGCALRLCGVNEQLSPPSSSVSGLRAVPVPVVPLSEGTKRRRMREGGRQGIESGPCCVKGTYS